MSFSIGLAGYSGAGKTTLLTKLITKAQILGYSSSTLKHIHHPIELDQPGKDSYRHSQAGAHEVMIVGEEKHALFGKHDLLLEGDQLLEQMLDKMSPVDILFIEGWKHGFHPKIEIHDPKLAMPLLAREDAWVKLVVGPNPPILPPNQKLSCPWVHRDDIDSILEFILSLKQNHNQKISNRKINGAA